MSTGPGPDLPTAAEIEEFRRRVREYEAKGEAERALDQLVDRFENWRRHERAQLQDWLDENRRDIASRHEQLSAREQAMVLREGKFDEEVAKQHRALEAREAKVLPSERLETEQRELEIRQVRLDQAEPELQTAREEVDRRSAELKRKENRLDSLLQQLSKDLARAQEPLDALQDISGPSWLRKRKDIRTAFEEARARVSVARRRLERLQAAIIRKGAARKG